MLFLQRLFPKNSDEVLDYFGARTVEGFSKFIDSNGKDNGKTAPPAGEVDYKKQPSLTYSNCSFLFQPAEQDEEDEDEEPLHEDL